MSRPKRPALDAIAKEAGLVRTRRGYADPNRVADMTVREFARHAHERGGTASFEIKPRLVECYPLDAPGLLTPEQLEAVRPFMRGTFSEMAEAIGDAAIWNAAFSDNFNRARLAVNALCDAADTVGWEGIERSLYKRCKALGVPPVLSKPRGVK